MFTLRLSGIILGLIGLILTWYLRFHLRRFRNFDWLMGNLLSISLIIIGLYPDIVNGVLNLFYFKKGGMERIIGLLVLSNFFLYFILYSYSSRIYQQEMAIDRLVRELAKKEYLQEYGRDPAPVYIIIPAYNESENIVPVIERIPAEVFGLKTKVLVVIDGATDNTAEVVSRLGRDLVSLTINRGGGSALIAGYELALAAGAEIVVTLDADGQHAPQEINDLVKPIIDGEANLVNGSRVIGRYEADSRLRALGVRVFGWLISALTMTRITDSSNGFRAIRASALAKLRLQQPQFHASEFIIEALKRDIKFKEVPVTVKRRLSGASKKPAAIPYAWGYVKSMVSSWLR